MNGSQRFSCLSLYAPISIAKENCREIVIEIPLGVEFNRSVLIRMNNTTFAVAKWDSVKLEILEKPTRRSWKHFSGNKKKRSVIKMMTFIHTYLLLLLLISVVLLCFLKLKWKHNGSFESISLSSASIQYSVIKLISRVFCRFASVSQWNQV